MLMQRDWTGHTRSGTIIGSEGLRVVSRIEARLAERRERVLQAIVQSMRPEAQGGRGRAPSIPELMRDVGAARQTVLNDLQALQAAGRIRRVPGEHYGIRVLSSRRR